MRFIEMSNYLEKISEMHLPVVVLRDTVPLPSVNTTFTISDKSGIAAARSANHPQSRIFIVAQHDVTEDEPTPDSLYTVGIVAKIKHSIITGVLSKDGFAFLTYYVHITVNLII
jgi:ATP-dependent Lon protease